MANEKHIDELIKSIEENVMDKQLKELNEYLSNISNKLDDIDKSIHQIKIDLVGYFVSIKEMSNEECGTQKKECETQYEYQTELHNHQKTYAQEIAELEAELRLKTLKNMIDDQTHRYDSVREYEINQAKRKWFGLKK